MIGSGVAGASRLLFAESAAFRFIFFLTVACSGLALLARLGASTPQTSGTNQAGNGPAFATQSGSTQNNAGPANTGQSNGPQAGASQAAQPYSFGQQPAGGAAPIQIQKAVTAGGATAGPAPAVRPSQKLEGTDFSELLKN